MDATRKAITTALMLRAFSSKGVSAAAAHPAAGSGGPDKGSAAADAGVGGGATAWRTTGLGREGRPLQQCSSVGLCHGECGTWGATSHPPPPASLVQWWRGHTGVAGVQLHVVGGH